MNEGDPRQRYGYNPEDLSEQGKQIHQTHQEVFGGRVTDVQPDDFMDEVIKAQWGDAEAAQFLVDILGLEKREELTDLIPKKIF